MTAFLPLRQHLAHWLRLSGGSKPRSTASCGWNPFSTPQMMWHVVCTPADLQSSVRRAPRGYIVPVQPINPIERDVKLLPLPGQLEKAGKGRFASNCPGPRNAATGINKQLGGEANRQTGICVLTGKNKGERELISILNDFITYGERAARRPTCKKLQQERY